MFTGCMNCTSNQLTGFYMRATLALNGPIRFSDNSAVQKNVILRMRGCSENVTLRMLLFKAVGKSLMKRDFKII